MATTAQIKAAALKKQIAGLTALKADMQASTDAWNAANPDATAITGGTPAAPTPPSPEDMPTNAAAQASAKAKAAADKKVADKAAADKAAADKAIADKAAADKVAADKAAAEQAAKDKAAVDKVTKDAYDKAQADAAAAALLQNQKADAFALINDTMATYGFDANELLEINKFIQDSLVNPQMGYNQTVLALRNTNAYKARFSGNATRINNGLNALSESNYLAQETAMKEYLTAHGVSKLGTRATLANLIGNGVSSTDVNTRAALAVDQVNNADPQILKQLQTYYPQISKGDLTSYFLDPVNTLPDLQQKVTIGQIGAAFNEQKLDASLSNMSDLAKFGVTQTQAIAGAGNIATVLPTAEKLGNIYQESGVKYGQQQGQEEFLKSDAAAARKREQLRSMERAQFQTDSGVNAQQGYGIARSIQGQF